MAEPNETDLKRSLEWLKREPPGSVTHFPLYAYAQGIADERERIVKNLLSHRGHRGIGKCIKDGKL